MKQNKIIEKIQDIADSLFEEWLERERSARLEVDLVSTFWYDFDEDSFREEFNEKTETGDIDMTYDSYFEIGFRKMAKEWFDNRIDEIVYDFTYNLDLEGDKMRIYRKISILTTDIPVFIESIKNKKPYLEYSGVGEYFAYKEELAEAHWGKFDKGYSQVTVVALVDFNCISLSESILKNLDTNLGDLEAEIQIEGKEVFVERVDDEPIQSVCLL